MKRKRGNKKGKSKKPPLVGGNEAVSNVVNPNAEDNSGLDDYNKDESDSEMETMETETPSSTGTDQQVKIVSTDSAGLDKTKPPERLVYGRVKVKIKTSKNLESQLTSSDAPTQSDTDKSGQQVGLEKQVVREKMEDSANSLPEISVGVPANLSKKAGSIKIKSSKGFSSSSLSPCNNVDKDVSLERSANEQKRGGDSVREYSPVSDNKPSGTVKDLSRRGPQQNKQELNAALEVVKKIMKMDAAEPFNVPVNPIALGIPDYFDVIDTPMDFGTICNNIESGVKYMNAEDVLKDVQFIWGNCYKYNNKGDYILELMKRVKKNFAKYWTAAGLSNEHMQGVENSQSKDTSSGKMPVKGGLSKHKSRKRQKVKRHKDDCLCAICVMMRRRQEREESAQIDEDHNETSDSRLAQEVKPEETSLVESLGGEGTSSSMDNSVDQDADADMEDKGDEVKREDTEQQQRQQQLYSPLQEKQAEEGMDNEVTKGDGEISEHSQLGERTEDEHNNRDHHTQTAELGSDTQNETRKEEISMQQVDETAVVEHQKPKESLDKIQKARICENLRRFENPMLLELCGTLFSDNPKSLWRGPHSLIHRQGPTRSSPIHAAVATFMK